MGCAASRAAAAGRPPDLDVVRVQDSVAVAKKRMQPGHLQALNNKGKEDAPTPDDSQSPANSHHAVTFATTDDTATAVSKIRAQNVQDSVIVTKERLRAANEAASHDEDEESPDSYVIGPAADSSVRNSGCQNCSSTSNAVHEVAHESGPTHDSSSSSSNGRRRAAVDDDTGHHDMVHNLQPELGEQAAAAQDARSLEVTSAVQFASDPPEAAAPVKEEA